MGRPAHDIFEQPKIVPRHSKRIHNGSVGNLKSRRTRRRDDGIDFRTDEQRRIKRVVRGFDRSL